MGCQNSLSRVYTSSYSNEVSTTWVPEINYTYLGQMAHIVCQEPFPKTKHELCSQTDLWIRVFGQEITAELNSFRRFQTIRLAKIKVN